MQHVRRFGNAIAISLQRDAKTWLLLFSLVYFFVTLVGAMRPFWFDELITYYVSRLPTMADVWAALRAGVDLNPPLLYIATRASQSAFGDGRVATRLPEMTGFLLMCLCMYKFVARRCPSPYAFVAFLFPLVTSGYSYAAEARSYGLEFGFLGIALVAWQSASQPGRRLGSLVLFYLALMAALLTHCYAVIALIPFGIAEVTRGIRTRQLDWPLLLCFVGLAPVGLVYWPLFVASRQFIVNNAVFRPTVLSVPDFYGALLRHAIWPMIGAVLIADRRLPENRSEGRAIPLHELTCALGFVLIPLFALVLALSVTGIFMDRYGMASMIGIGIAFAFYLYHRAGRDAGQGGVFAVVFLLSIILYGAAGSLEGNGSGARNPPLNLAAVRPDLPIVISNGLMFLELDHNEPATVATRLRFLTDGDAGLRYTGSNVFDVWVLRKWFPIRGKIQDYNDFMRSNGSFLVYGTYSHPLDWLILRLSQDNVHMRFLAAYPSRYGESLLLEKTAK